MPNTRSRRAEGGHAGREVTRDGKLHSDDLKRGRGQSAKVCWPSLPFFSCFNPAWAEVQNQHVWGQAWADIMTVGKTPQAAADKAFEWVDQIFAKIPDSQS